MQENKAITHKERCAIPVTWKAGDTVSANGKLGTVRYVYTNGYTLLQFPGETIKGGIFNNSSTYPNELLTLVGVKCH